MTDALIYKFAALPARQLHLAGGGLLLIALASLWFYALRAPLAQLRNMRAEHARLATINGDPRLLGAQLAVIQSDSAELARALGRAPQGAAAPLVMQLISDVGALAARHNVTLHGTSPLPEEKTAGFEQVGIDADASGRYADLLAWIDAMEKSQPNLAIERFSMRAGAAPGDVRLKLGVVVYRPVEARP